MFRYPIMIAALFLSWEVSASNPRYGEQVEECFKRIWQPVYEISQVGEIVAGGRVNSTATKLNDGTLVMGSLDGYIYLFDLKGIQKDKVKVDGSLFGKTVLLDGGETAALGTTNGKVHFVNARGDVVSLDIDDETGDIVIVGQEEGNNIIAQSIDTGKVYLINRDLEPVGTELLFNMEETGVYLSPTIIGGKVVVGTKEGKVFVYDPGDGSMENIYDTAGSRVYISPLENGEILVGSSNGKIYRMNTAGEIDATLFDNSQESILSMPIVVKNNSNDSVVVFGTHKGGRAHFLDLNVEKTPVSVLTEGVILASPVSMNDGTIIMVANDGVDSKIHFFNPDGSENASRQLSGMVYVSATVVDDGDGNETVIVGTSTGHIYLLQLSDERTVYIDQQTIEVACPSDSIGAVHDGPRDEDMEEGNEATVGDSGSFQ